MNDKIERTYIPVMLSGFMEEVRQSGVCRKEGAPL
jgi:hypothetical protein